MGGGSNTSPGVEGERGRVEDENTHRGTPYLGWGEGRRLPLQGGARNLPLLGGRTRSLPLLNGGERCIPREGRESPPPPGKGERMTGEGRRGASRTDQKNRHGGLIRAGNYAC